MNERGHYGISVGARGRSTLGPRGRSFYVPRSVVGSQLQHVLTLDQRYEGVHANGMAALLAALGSDGVISSTGANHWEVALRDGNAAWVQFAWDPSSSVLQVTITDKQPHPIDQVRWVRNNFEKILREKITPRLQGYGAVVVGRIYHSVGDRQDAVKQMDFDWTALFQDLAVQAGELTRDPNSSSGYHFTSQIEFDALKPDPKKVAWWKSFAKPRFKDWVKFRTDQLGQDATVAPNYQAWTERFATDWSIYEEWKDKLDALRSAAQQAGFTIGVPAAQSLPTTVVEDVSTVAKKGAGVVATGVGDVWTLAKYGAWAVLGIGAVVALSSVVQNLRSGKDPAEKYVELIRDRRRVATRAALPSVARLALPAGEPA